MASHPTFLFFLVAALLFISTIPISNGQRLGNNNLNGLTVTGRLCCTSTGNCPGQGVVGALVSLNCSTRLFGPAVSVGQTTTGTNGVFNITVPKVQGLVLGFPILPCFVNVQVPLDSSICPALSTANGSLVSPVIGIGTVVSNTLGRIQNAFAIGYINLRLRV